ncbi:3d411623-6a3a-4396-acf5-62451ea5aa8b [Thermothielavioides terrestris]|uniref:3d411623-6a3a-4396-acf5-62451ea5aa8b n=1 Tax=Thermothielavioides terrestris TaxID=2587410 RepID=A0A446BDQ7_9PEZI|nr:3d411623-6a3a-4396-acf5-62451ea5aa8b [Thermothielavioides terrestris]
MSPPYESSRRRGVWSHWVPLVLTLTVATVGVAAWIWSQREDEDHEDAEQPGAYQDLDYENADYGDNPPTAQAETADNPPARATPAMAQRSRPRTPRAPAGRHCGAPRARSNF